MILLLKVVDYFGLVKCKKTSFQEIRGRGGANVVMQEFCQIQIETSRDSLDGSEVSCKLTS